ncbi:MAG: cbb3-type cytochrome oxidase assembly protein CcoS [Bacteroidota bacterium]
MTVILVLIIASIIVAGGFLVAFIWSVKSGQYDDAVTPSIRMLLDNPTENNNKNNSNNQSNKSIVK